MANQYVNKVIINGATRLDLTSDTVDTAHLLSGYTAHSRSGAPVTGSCAYDAATGDATAAESEILSGKTAYVSGARLTGSMTNNGGMSAAISTKTGQVTVPQGHHDGSGKVQIASAEQAKLIAGNIKQGVTILGVTGTYGGSTQSAEANKNVTPSFSQQIVTPSSGYDYLAQVTVAAIPLAETDNAQGGVTLTVG